MKAASLFYEVSETVREEVPGFRALALVSLDGGLTEHDIADQSLPPDILSEFATLIRIAHHASEDTRNGELLETFWTADRSIVLARRVTADSFLILVGEPELRTGFARYVLRRAAWQLRPQFESAPQ